MKKILSYVMSLMALLVVICFASCANPGSSSGEGNGGEPEPCKVIIYPNYPNVSIPSDTDDYQYYAYGYSCLKLCEEQPTIYTPGIFINFTKEYISPFGNCLRYDTYTNKTLKIDRPAYVYDIEVCFPQISNKQSFLLKEYEVDHYNTKADDTGKKYYPNTNYVLNEDLDLYCFYKLVESKTEQELLDYINAHPEIIED